MNIISIILGLLAAPFIILGNVPIPFLGVINWLGLPVAILGAALGALSEQRTGFYMNLVLIAGAAFRLTIGGGCL